MNKGRNIAILMAVMLCISIEFFFMLLGRNNNSGVVGNVRYIYESGELEDDTVKYYTFYYKDDASRDVTVSLQDDGSYYFTIEGYDYAYSLTGVNRRNYEVKYEYLGKYQGSEKEAYSLHTKKLFGTMAYGREPVLKLYEAIICSLIGGVGAIILGKAENLWYRFSKKKFPEDYEPVWDDFKMYRTFGGAMLAAAGVLLLLFILF